MGRTTGILTVIILAGILSCTTKDPDPLSFNVGSGGLMVSSSIHGAKIFIDHRDSGQNTPALIKNIVEGRHVVHLFLGGYHAVQDSILTEVIEGEETPVDFAMNETPAVGDLEIQTTPKGALVYINKLPFGRTPLSLTGFQQGTHKLKISKGGYAGIEQSLPVTAGQKTNIQSNLVLKDRLILVEHYSNTDCAPCPEADDIIEAVLLEKGTDSVSVISYHPDFPGRDDPFFLAAEEDNLTRYGYYNRPPLPYVVIDGLNAMAGTFNLEERFRNGLADRTGLLPAATLDFRDLFELLQEPNSIFGRVLIEALEDLTSPNIFLRLALIEQEITFPVAPGSNGQKHFFDVMRVLQPSPAGYPVNLLKGESEFFEFQFELQAEWSGNLQVVAFLQNDDGKEVLQSLWSVGE